MIEGSNVKITEGIINALAHGPLHGYAITQQIRKTGVSCNFHDVRRLLAAMEKIKYVQSEREGKRRVYKLTEGD